MDKTKLPMRRRMLRSVVLSKLEPTETIVCISAILHGLWLIFPNWGTSIVTGSIGTVGRMFEITVGALLAVVAVVDLVMMLKATRLWLRKRIAMVKFVVWSFLTWIALQAVGFFSIVWVAYLTITLISAAIYLNLGLRDVAE